MKNTPNGPPIGFVIENANAANPGFGRSMFIIQTS